MSERTEEENMRFVKSVADDLLEVLKARRTSKESAIGILGAVTSSILRSYDDRKETMAHACKFCLMLLVDCDADAMIDDFIKSPVTKPEFRELLERMVADKRALRDE